MEKRIIPLDHTGLFPRLVLDYLSLRDDMSPFYDYLPSMDGLLARLEEVKESEKDNGVLAKVLREQHGESVTTEQRQNIDALEADAAFTISTGHQLCLFGGPAYLIYKVISIIKLAERMSNQTGDRIVPLFWLASEDHDVDEVDHCFLFGKRITLRTEHQGPAGYISLVDIEESLSQLEDILGESEQAVKVLQMMRSAYRPSSNLSVALRALLQELFADKGLIILDADDIRLKQAFAPIMLKEMEEQVVEKAMTKAVEMLSNRGESVQATARQINLFYMTRESRSRIVQKGDRFSVLDSELSWSLEELREEMNVNPHCFSPNVLMRPVYQEFILPNLAYIGGPGELSYWLQLKDVFHAFGLRMPVALMRDSFLMLDQKVEVKMQALGLKLKDMFRDVDALHKDYAKSNASEEPDLTENKELLIQHFDDLIQRSQSIDPGIAQFAKAERQKLINSVENMEKKLVRAEKKKHSDALGRISQLKERILPGGGLEERKENFLRYYVPMGEEYLNRLFSFSDPLTPGLKVVTKEL